MKWKLGSVPEVSMAGINIPLSQAIILTAELGTTAYYDCLRNKGVAYQVPAGFKLVMVATKIVAGTAVAAGAAFGEATAVATNQVGAPAGYSVFAIGGGGNFYGYTKGAIGEYIELPMYLEFAAGKYPTVQGYAVPTIICLCYLVAV